MTLGTKYTMSYHIIYYVSNGIYELQNIKYYSILMKLKYGLDCNIDKNNFFHS